MHNGIYTFVKEQKEKGRVKGRTLEVGSLDFNGGVRDLMPGDYVGTDMQAGKGVDRVVKAELLWDEFGSQEFETIIWLDAWEHTEHWRSALLSIWEVLGYDGWLIVSIAGIGKGFHGYPGDFHRMTPAQVLEIFPGAVDITNLKGISMGWAVQKKAPLPDLSKIELLKVNDHVAISKACEENPAFKR